MINLNKKKIWKYIKYGILLFITISILGFIYEEIVYLFKMKTIVKRGYLYGPWLPIYGFGSILILTTCYKLKKQGWIFILTFFLTGTLEFLTGYFLKHVRHKRLWNYTGEFLNIGGYICLRSLIGFALGGLKLNDKQTTVLSISLLIIFIIDNLVTMLK